MALFYLGNCWWLVSIGMRKEWYSRNNRRLWCSKSVKAEAVEVCMSSVDTAFRHGLTTLTDALSLTSNATFAQLQTFQRGSAFAVLLLAVEVPSILCGCDRESRWPSVKEARRHGKHLSRAGTAGQNESACFGFGEGRRWSYALGQDASCHPGSYLCKSLVWFLPKRVSTAHEESRRRRWSMYQLLSLFESNNMVF